MVEWTRHDDMRASEDGWWMTREGSILRNPSSSKFRRSSDALAYAKQQAENELFYQRAWAESIRRKMTNG